MKLRGIVLLLPTLCICLVIGNAQSIDQNVTDSLIQIYSFQSQTLSKKEELEIVFNIAKYSTKPIENLNFGKRAFELSRGLNDQSSEAGALLLIGQAYSSMGKYDIALEYLFESMHLYMTINDPSRIASVNMAIGNLYLVQKNIDKSFEYYRKAVIVLKKQTGPKYLPTLSASLLNIGEAYRENEMYDSAMLYFNEAYSMFNQIGSKPGVAYAKGNIGLVNIACGEIQRGRNQLLQAIKMLEELGDNYPIAVYLLSLADISLLESNESQAKKYARQSLRLAQKENLTEQIRDAYQKLFLICERMGQHANALSYYKDYIAIRDSINNEELYKRMLDVETNYKMAQKESEIKFLKNNQELRGFVEICLIVLVLLILTFAWLQYYNNKVRKSVNEKLGQQKEELSEKNEELNVLVKSREKLYSIIAHDLRGPVKSFGSLLHLLNIYIDKKNYGSLHEIIAPMEKGASNLSNLLDDLLNWSMQQGGKIEITKTHVHLHKIVSDVVNIFHSTSMAKRIDLTYYIDESIYIYADKDSVFTIIRNLVNNALKFTPARGEVVVTAEIKDKKIVQVKVKDTGIGMSQNKIKAIRNQSKIERTWGTSGEKGLGFGLQIVKEFLHLNGGFLDIESEEGQGATFIVSLSVSQKTYSAPISIQTD